jgi:hypothetical protein
MNERLKELAVQAGLMPMWVCVNEPTGSQVIKPIDEQVIERFAELVRADEQEPQVCCGDYEKCWKACTPRGRWLAEKELRKEWVGLTDEEIDQAASEVCFGYIDVARAVEAKLKERNSKNTT